MHVLRVLVLAFVILGLGLPAEAQPADTVSVSDTLSSNGDSFVVPVRGMASARFQTLDSYSGTWEVECSVDGGVTYDTDDELNLSLEGASAAAVQAVTDTVAIYTANIAACTHVRVIATAGFAATDTVVAVGAIAAGGGSAASGSTTATGNLTNDSAAATSNRIATLPVITETSAPIRTNGRDAALSGTAGGSIRVMIADAAGAAVTVATDATHDSAASATGPQVMGSGKNTTLPTAVTDGDATRLMTDLFGRLTPKNICEDPDLVSSVVISTATSGNVQLVALSGSTVVTVCGFNVVSTGTVAVQFISGTGSACATGETDKTGAMPFVANGGINTGFGNKIFSGAAGEAVCVELSAAIQIDGVLTYVQR